MGKPNIRCKMFVWKTMENYIYVFAVESFFHSRRTRNICDQTATMDVDCELDWIDRRRTTRVSIFSMVVYDGDPERRVHRKVLFISMNSTYGARGIYWDKPRGSFSFVMLNLFGATSAEWRRSVIRATLLLWAAAPRKVRVRPPFQLGSAKRSDDENRFSNVVATPCARVVQPDARNTYVYYIYIHAHRNQFRLYKKPVWYFYIYTYFLIYVRVCGCVYGSSTCAYLPIYAHFNRCVWVFVLFIAGICLRAHMASCRVHVNSTQPAF